MILIKKNEEPKSLREYKSKGGTNYNDFRKDELRESLIREQRYLCAYCMERIRLAKPNETTTTKIEHLEPQTKENELDYQNMLLCCDGNKNSKAYRSCDTKKGNTPIAFDPKKSEHIETLSYGSDGTLKSSKMEFQHDIDNVLNLNTHIKRNRKKALDSYIEAYKRKNKGYSRETLIRERKRLLEKEQYIPYLGIILYKLDKKIRSKE